MRSSNRRRPALLLTLLIGWLLAGVAGAGAASAHAELESTDPGEGARLSATPSAVTLTFSEGISVGAGYARVLDSAGDRVDAGAPSVDGGTVTIPLRDRLGEDGYLVTYRIISADSHPVAGAFSFTVGDAALVDSSVAGADDDPDPVVAAALPIARWLGFAGLALAVGAPAVVALCWPGGWTAPRVRRLVRAGLGVLAVGTLTTFLLQGPYAAGAGLGSTFAPALLWATVGSELGVALLVRLAMTAALAVVLRTGSVIDPRSPRVWVGGALAAGLVLTTSAVGHPVAGRWPALAVVATTAHVAAMTCWLGGLVVLLAGVLRSGVPAGEMGTALTRFSRLAAAAVGVLVVSGVVQSVREVGSPSALFETGYGRLLLAKLALVALLLAAAGASRVWVQQRLGVRRPRPGVRRRELVPAGGPVEVEGAGVREAGLAESAAAERGMLRRSVLVELALGVVVLALSAVLVGSAPARAAVADPLDVTLPLQGSAGEQGSVQLSLDPAQPGPNTLHVYLFDDSGQLTQPADLRVTLTEPEQQIGPLAVDLEAAGPGHYVSDDLDVPGAGTWQLAVTVRLDEFTAVTAQTDVPVH